MSNDPNTMNKDDIVKSVLEIIEILKTQPAEEGIGKIQTLLSITNEYNEAKMAYEINASEENSDKLVTCMEKMKELHALLEPRIEEAMTSGEFLMKLIAKQRKEQDEFLEKHKGLEKAKQTLLPKTLAFNRTHHVPSLGDTPRQLGYGSDSAASTSHMPGSARLLDHVPVESRLQPLCTDDYHQSLQMRGHQEANLVAEDNKVMADVAKCLMQENRALTESTHNKNKEVFDSVVKTQDKRRDEESSVDSAERAEELENAETVFASIAAGGDTIPMGDFGKLINVLGTKYREEKHGKYARAQSNGDGIITKEAFVAWYLVWIFRDEDDEDD